MFFSLTRTTGKPLHSSNEQLDFSPMIKKKKITLHLCLDPNFKVKREINKIPIIHQKYTQSLLKSAEILKFINGSPTPVKTLFKCLYSTPPEYGSEKKGLFWNKIEIELKYQIQIKYI